MPVLEVSTVSSSSDESAAKGGFHHADTDTPSSSSTYTAKRFAIKFQPPCLFLEYSDANSQKTRVRAVKLTRLSTDMDLDRLTRKVIRSFPRKLDPSSIKYGQVRKLVARLVERLRSSPPSALAQPNDVELLQNTLPKPAPSLGPPELAEGGASPMRLPARGKEEPQGDARDSTESRFSTSDLGTCRGQNGKHRHPDLDEAMQQLERELVLDDKAYGSNGSPQGAPSQAADGEAQPSGGLHRPAAHMEAATSRGGQQASRFKQEAEETLTLELDIGEDTDLNKVSEVELRLAKQQMEREFSKHQLRPGDPGYQYDKQVEFGPPTNSNDWDDSDD